MEQQTLEYTVYGAEHERTIVFVHGWPDDASMWSEQIEGLQDSYRCIAVTLPNFGDTADRSGAYHFSELVSLLEQTIASVQPSGEPVFLVTHDWGAYIGYLFEQAHPHWVKATVALDVGVEVRPGFLEGLGILAYQWHLIGSWFLGGVIPPLGRAHAQWMAKMMKVKPKRVARIQSRFSYPYWVLWMDMLMPWRWKNKLSRYTPKSPLFFIYGAQKPIQFHTDRWLGKLERWGGDSACIEEGDHWFMESHPSQTNTLIRDWFQRVTDTQP